MLSPWGWLSQVHTSVLLKHLRRSASARSWACFYFFLFKRYNKQAQLRAEADRRGFLSSTDVWIWDNQPHGDSIQSYSPFINWWSRKTFDISGSTKSNTRIFCQLLSFIIRLTKIFYTVLIKPWLINYYISQLTF